jgi:hypothetical protein
MSAITFKWDGAAIVRMQEALSKLVFNRAMCYQAIVEIQGLTDMAGLVAQLTRAYIIWSLLIGQGVLIATMFVAPDAIKALTVEAIVAVMVVSGFVGLAVEWLWHDAQECRHDGAAN